MILESEEMWHKRLEAARDVDHYIYKVHRENIEYIANLRNPPIFSSEDVELMVFFKLGEECESILLTSPNKYVRKYAEIRLQ